MIERASAPDVPGNAGGGAFHLPLWATAVFATLSTAATMWLRLLIDGPLGGRPTLLIFTMPIMLSAYIGGVWPGLMATALTSLGASYYLMPPLHSLAVTSNVDRFQLLFIVLSGVGISLLNEVLHLTRRRADLAALRVAKSQAALRAEEGRYRALVDWSPEAIAVHRDARLLFVNPAAVRLFGAKSAAELVGTHVFQLVHPDSHAYLHERFQSVGENRGAEPVAAFTLLRMDGSTVEAESQGTSINYDGAPATLVSLRDISERGAHEREIGRLNRLLDALSHVNQAIARHSNRTDLFRSICDILAEKGGFRRAMIGWYDDDSQLLMPAATAGDNTTAVAPVDVHAERRALTAIAFRTGTRQVSNDMSVEVALRQWHGEFDRHGFRAAAAFPIRERGNVCGTLTVYADEADVFQDREIGLLDEVAADLSFALDSFAREAAQQESESRYRTLFERAPDGIVIANGHGYYIDANNAACVMLGYSREEMRHLRATDIVAPAEHEHIASAREAIGVVSDYHREWTFTRKDGSTFPADVVSTQMPNGNPMGMIRDITDRRATEAALRDAASRIASIVDSAMDAVITIDADQCIVLFNPAAERMFGYASVNVLGESIEYLIPLLKRSDHAQHIRTSAKSGMTSREMGALGAISGLRANGEEFPIEASISQAEVANQTLSTIILRDITERRQAEDQIRELNTDLERRVRERTVALQRANTELEAFSTAVLRDLRVAQAADQVKSSFLATMSHELRTPLNSIIGFTGIVLQRMAGPLTAEQEKQLGMVRGSARHLLELINDVLDLSKIEAGQLEVRTERFDLRAVIERVVASVRPLAERKTLTLTTAIAPEIGETSSDRRRVEQILLNLLSNAIKFTETGAVALSASVSQAPTSVSGAARRVVRIEVRDTGIGITPENLATLFQPFRQIDSGLARQSEGTGLGLAISRRLAELLHGEIGADSKWNEGSVFTLVLPFDGPETS